MEDSDFRQERFLKDWFSEPLGRNFLELEKEKVGKLIDPFYGNFLLCLGELPFVQVILNSAILHKIWIHPQAEAQEVCSSLSSRQDKLPIGGDEIHLVYLAHCLEFIKNPHEVLRESFRVLLPEGHVVISGFNPWSLWGVWQWFHFKRKWPWRGCFISMTRLKDWLALLGFDVVSVHFYFFKPPVGFKAVMERLKWLEFLGRFLWPIFGGSYVVVAKKRVVTLTPIKPQWSTQKKLMVEGLVGPTTRSPG